MPADDCRKRFTAKALEPVRDFAEVWFKRAPHITFHDPLAAACVFEPDLCGYKQGKVTVSLCEPTMGWTVFSDRAEEKPHTVAHQVDPGRFFEHYFGVVR
jgi:purine nucleosidase